MQMDSPLISGDGEMCNESHAQVVILTVVRVDVFLDTLGYDEVDLKTHN